MEVNELRGMSIRIGEPVQITEARSECWFPTIAKFDTGELIVQYSLVPDSNYNSFDLGGYQVSRDGARTWGNRYEIVDDHQPRIYLPLSKGSMLAIPARYFRVSSSDAHNFYGTYTLIEDGGSRFIVEPEGVRIVEWPWPVEVNDMTGQIGFKFDGNVFEDNGRIYATLYGKGHGEDTQLCASMLAESDDKGRTWRYFSTIAAPSSLPGSYSGSEGFTETSLVRLSNGDLMAFIRIGSGLSLYKTYSRDMGKTWDEPIPAGPCSVEPSLVRMQNGILALSTGRPGIKLWLSDDNTGENWQEVDILKFHNDWALDDTWMIDAHSTTAYTEIIEVSPNRLLLVYDRNVFGWRKEKGQTGSENERNRIFVMALDIERK